MALKLTVNTASGISVPDAIHRIQCITLHGKTILAFLVRRYATLEAVEPFDESGYECAYVIGDPEQSENPLVQAYEHLKGLPEFAGCSDT